MTQETYYFGDVMPGDLTISHPSSAYWAQGGKWILHNGGDAPIRAIMLTVSSLGGNCGLKRMGANDSGNPGANSMWGNTSDGNSGSGNVIFTQGKSYVICTATYKSAIMNALPSTVQSDFATSGLISYDPYSKIWAGFQFGWLCNGSVTLTDFRAIYYYSTKKVFRDISGLIWCVPLSNRSTTQL